jgi:hypothetical protein
VWANEEYIEWWSAILTHIHWRFLKENSCLSFEGQRSFFFFSMQYKFKTLNYFLF